MLTGKTRTLRTHPNLLPLQLALTVAESVTPAQPPRADINEQRAAQLIHKMQAGYQRPSIFSGLHEIPSPDVRLHLHPVELSHA